MSWNIPVARVADGYDPNVVSRETGLGDFDQSLTVQSEMEDADINTIVERFGLTGQLPSGVRMPVSGDFTGVSDYHTAVNMVIAADKAFMEFPADVRKRFNHDPAEMMAFLEDPGNRIEAEKLGLVVPGPVPGGANGNAPSISPAPAASA